MAGSALPLVSFMTAPTKNPSKFFFPSRYFLACSGLAAMTFSMVVWSAPLSATFCSPNFSTQVLASLLDDLGEDRFCCAR
jgi:hypothetical protein